jgi:hypothetical protein
VVVDVLVIVTRIVSSGPRLTLGSGMADTAAVGMEDEIIIELIGAGFGSPRRGKVVAETNILPEDVVVVPAIDSKVLSGKGDEGVANAKKPLDEAVIVTFKAAAWAVCPAGSPFTLARCADTALNLAGSTGGTEVRGGLLPGLFGMAWTMPACFWDAVEFETGIDIDVAEAAAAGVVIEAIEEFDDAAAVASAN